MNQEKLDILTNRISTENFIDLADIAEMRVSN